MAWTYLKKDEDGELLEGSPTLPGPQTVYLGFDVVRNAIVLGYTERGGYHSMLAPNVTDDCQIVAFAPLTETTFPDLEQIRLNTPYKDVMFNPDAQVPILLHSTDFKKGLADWNAPNSIPCDS